VSPNVYYKSLGALELGGLLLILSLWDSERTELYGEATVNYWIYSVIGVSVSRSRFVLPETTAITAR
jgi:hypothetical protein